MKAMFLFPVNPTPLGLCYVLSRIHSSEKVINLRRHVGARSYRTRTEPEKLRLGDWIPSADTPCMPYMPT